MCGCSTRNLSEECPGLGLETGPSEFPDRYKAASVSFSSL
jgi:hypothetical protein